jgi:hypothetical protein
MKNLVLFLAVTLILSGCSWVRRDQVQSQVREMASKITHPPDSIVVLTADDLMETGNSETCLGSDKFFLIGATMSRLSINDYYSHQFDGSWSVLNGPEDHKAWSKTDGGLTIYVSIEYKNSLLESVKQYREAVIVARAQYSASYVLVIGSTTSDSCKG